MSYGLCNQLEPDLWKQISWNPDMPWRMRRRSNWRGFEKKAKVRVERRRAKLNPECPPYYKRFSGWEY